MNVIIVINENPYLSYKDKYRIFNDTEIGKKKAIDWAVKNGFKSFLPLDLKIGMLNLHCEEYKIGIMRLEVADDNLNEDEK